MKSEKGDKIPRLEIDSFDVLFDNPLREKYEAMRVGDSDEEEENDLGIFDGRYSRNIPRKKR